MMFWDNISFGSHFIYHTTKIISPVRRSIAR
jgi:hypothetical protein